MSAPVAPDRGRPRRRHTARAELTLARADIFPLNPVGLVPDPLTAFARALSALRDDLGETAEIAVDLLPITPGQRHRRRRRLLAGRHSDRSDPLAAYAHGWGSGGRGGWARRLIDELASPPVSGRAPRRDRPPAPRGLAALEARTTGRRMADKLLTTGPVFALQLLVRIRSQVPGRAHAHLAAVLAGFNQWNGENHLRVVGVRLGPRYLGADLPVLRWWFDQRMDGGYFRPRGRRGAPWVSAEEIAGLIKPPTRHCTAPNVLRSGGVIPPPPTALPLYTGQADLLPLGLVRTLPGLDALGAPAAAGAAPGVAREGALAPRGVPLADTLFALVAGRAGFGKSTLLMNQALALIHAGHGVAVLDPHDVADRIKPFLADVADRVLEVDLKPAALRGREPRQAGWNPLCMWRLHPDGTVTRRPPSDIEGRVNCVVDSFAAALRWGEINNRALTLVTMAAQALCELGLKLPPHAQPTLFQMSTLLSQPDWRDALLPYLSPATADFFAHRFPQIAGEVTPVTNLLDRLRASPSIASLLGASTSTFELRTAMDAGSIVLLSPGGSGQRAKLINAFFVYDLLQSALSREDIPTEAARRPFYAFIDELPAVDSPTFAALLEQTRKYGLRLFAFAQQPERLTKTTLEALKTNRSHLLSTTVGHESARLLAREWGNAVAPETVVRLDRFTFLASVTLHGRITPPFLVHGFRPEQLHAAHHRPDRLADLEHAIDANLARRPAAETLAQLATLDERILDELAAPRPADPTGRSGASGGSGGRGSGRPGTRLTRPARGRVAGDSSGQPTRNAAGRAGNPPHRDVAPPEPAPSPAPGRDGAPGRPGAAEPLAPVADLASFRGGPRRPRRSDRG